MTDHEVPPLTDTGQEIVHWAGSWFRVGNQLRQRCGWCGAVLIDVDLATIMRPVEDVASTPPDHPTGGVPMWEHAAFVAHDGVAWWLVEPAGDETPENCCTRLPHDVTGARAAG